MIIVEKFDPNKWTLEKTGWLKIADGVFNVSEGYIWNIYHEDLNLPESRLWSDKSVEELRLQYWDEIQRFLPSFKRYYQPIINDVRTVKGYYTYKTYLPNGQQYLWYLMDLVVAYNVPSFNGKLKLIYVSDREKAELIKRVVIWLNSQFD